MEVNGRGKSLKTVILIKTKITDDNFYFDAHPYFLVIKKVQAMKVVFFQLIF